MSDATTQHTPADVRERVAKIVREAMEDARRSERLNTFPQSSMWDYADRILALLRTPRGEGEVTYPCRQCGTPRTAAEGGTTFTVCDECWDRQYGRPAAGARTMASERDPIPCPVCREVIIGPLSAAVHLSDMHGLSMYGALARLARELEEARERERGYREALERVVDGGCEHFVGTDCWQMGMDPNAKDYADRVCDPCFARLALATDTEGGEAEPPAHPVRMAQPDEEMAL